MRALVVFAVGGAITYLARASSILLIGDRPLHPDVERAIRYVGPAVLSALTVSLLMGDGVMEFITNIPEVAGTVVAVAVAVWTRSLLYSFIAAVATLGVLQFLL